MSYRPAPFGTEGNPQSQRKTFNCELCRKEYLKATDLDAHEKGYDHQHAKRLKDMRAMTRKPGAASSKAKRDGDLEMISTASAPAATSAPEAGLGSTRAIGFGAAVSVSADADAEEGVRAPSPHVEYEDRMLYFDELDEVDGMLDLETNRPAFMREAMQLHAIHTGHGKDYYDAIWRRSLELRKGVQ